MMENEFSGAGCCPNCGQCRCDQASLDDYGRLGTGTVIEAMLTAVVLLAVMVPVFLVTGQELPLIDWQRPELLVFLGLFGGLFVAGTLLQVIARNLLGRI